MKSMSIYLNFQDSAEAAFAFYGKIFGTEPTGIFRYGDMPSDSGMPAVSDEQKNLVMNISMPIPGGVTLMASDMGPGMTFDLTIGNNIQIGLHADSREEADRLYAALSSGGTTQMPLADQFWGDYYGELVDQFGITWLVFFTPES